MQGEEESYFCCPYCFQTISMVFDIYYGQQTYIEDCEVCCHPIEITFDSDGESITSVKIERI